MTCQPPRAPRHPGMKTSSLMLFLSPTQGPEEDPQARLVSEAYRGRLGPATETLGVASQSVHK